MTGSDYLRLSNEAGARGEWALSKFYFEMYKAEVERLAAKKAESAA